MKPLILSNSRILILSPESWESNFLSKHHLAIALTKFNNQVFFVNPPSTVNRCYAREQYQGIKIIDYKPTLRGLNRLPQFISSVFEKADIKTILKLIDGPIDVVWTFDPFRFQQIKNFGASKSVYFMADTHQATQLEQRLVSECDLLLSPSEQILQMADHPSKFCIGHMISDDFVQMIEDAKPMKLPGEQKIKIVYAGNLLSRFLDYELLLATVKQNPQFDFIFIGETQSLMSNRFWQEIVEYGHVYFSGRKKHEELALLLASADVLWHCYNTKAFWHEASNSHKILEYLATGKVVVGPALAYYQDFPGILIAPNKQEELPETLTRVVDDLAYYNSESLMHKRKNFSLARTYSKGLLKIDNLLVAIRT